MLKVCAVCKFAIIVFFNSGDCLLVFSFLKEVYEGINERRKDFILTKEFQAFPNGMTVRFQQCGFDIYEVMKENKWNGVME